MKFLHFSFKNIKFIMMIRDWNFQTFVVDFSSKTFHSSIFLSISYDKFMRRMRYGDDDDADDLWEKEVTRDSIARFNIHLRIA